MATRRRRRRAPKTPAQIAASKRNLEKARAARQYGHLSPGTYIIKNNGSIIKQSVKTSKQPKPIKVKVKTPAQKSVSKPLVGNKIRASLSVAKKGYDPDIKYHPYTGKPYNLRDIKGHRQIPLIGLKGANEWLKANTIRRNKKR